LKPITRALLVLLILTLAAGGIVYYWMFARQTIPVITTGQPAAQFTFFLNPPFFHVAAGEGKNITTFVQRTSGFSGAVKIEIVNPPSWITYNAMTVDTTVSNATFAIIASQDAPKTELNLTVRASSAGAADQVATLDMKVVGVSTVTSDHGSAVLYDTTKFLDTDTLKSLTAYSNGTFVFSAVTPQLQSLARGDVMVVQPSSTPLAKFGLVRLVLSVTREGGGVIVQTIQATLFDELQQLHVGFGNATSVQAAPGSLAPAAIPDNPNLPTGTTPNVVFEDWFTLYSGHFGTGGERSIPGGDVTFSADAGIGVELGPMIDIAWSVGHPIPSLDQARLNVIYWEDLTLAVKGSAGSQLNYEDDNLQQLYYGSIPLVPGVWLVISATLEGKASGTLQQNINGYFHQGMNYEMGPTYSSDEGWFFYYRCNSETRGECDPPTFDNPQFSISAGSGSDATIELGPMVKVSVDADIGVADAAGFASLSGLLFVTLKSQIPRPSDRPHSWWLEWGLDGDFELGLSLSVGISVAGYEIGFSTCLCSPPAQGRLIGPGTLFNGFAIPPLVTITSPKDGSNLDYNSLTIFPSFTATATGEDGDLCSGPPQNLIWSDEYGQIGTGCTLPSVTFNQDGVHHIQFTATDSAGSSSSATVTVSVILAKPDVYITKPLDNEQFMVDEPVTLEGYAMLKLTNLPCNGASGKLVFNIWLYANIPSQPESGTQYCTATTTFDKPGTYSIFLVAQDSSGKTTGFSKHVEINIIEPSQGTNYPPSVQIISPNDQQSFLYLNWKITLDGTVFDWEGDPLGTYTWSYVPLSLSQSPVTIATGPLPPSSQCTKDTPCHVTASLNTNDYCKDNPTGGDLAIVLEATETGPVEQTGKSQPVTIHLSCEKQVAIITPIINQPPPAAHPNVSVSANGPQRRILENHSCKVCP